MDRYNSKEANFGGHYWRVDISNDLQSWFEPCNIFRFLFRKLLAWKVHIIVGKGQMQKNETSLFQLSDIHFHLFFHFCGTLNICQVI